MTEILHPNCDTFVNLEYFCRNFYVSTVSQVTRTAFPHFLNFYQSYQRRVLGINIFALETSVSTSEMDSHFKTRALEAGLLAT